MLFSITKCKCGQTLKTTQAGVAVSVELPDGVTVDYEAAEVEVNSFMPPVPEGGHSLAEPIPGPRYSIVIRKVKGNG